MSKEQAAAYDLVRRSEQMSVPVNGKLVTGFDKPKINKLLEIKH